MAVVEYKKLIALTGLGLLLSTARAENNRFAKKFSEDTITTSKKLGVEVVVESTTIYDMLENSDTQIALQSTTDPVEEISNDFKFWIKAALPDNPTLAKKWGMEGSSGRDFLKWFGERVHVITGADHTRDSFWTSRFKVDKSLPLPQEYINWIGSAQIQDASINAIASNLGRSLLVMSAAAKNALVYSNIHMERIVEGARFGMIRIYPEFFSNAFHLDQVGNSKIASISRIATLIHEARHSDGNGSSLAFMHTLCPAGHSFSGKSVCDRSENGAFGIEVALLRQFLNSANTQTQESEFTFSQDEIVVLEGLILDAQNYILDPTIYKTDGKGIPVVKFLDPTPYRIPGIPKS